MRLLLLTFVLTFGAIKASISPLELLMEEWETWKLTHGKTYEDDRQLYGGLTNSVYSPGMGEQEKFRMKIWIENKIAIEKHNQAALRGEHSFHLAMNQFGDLLNHEFVSMMNGYKHRDVSNDTETKTPARLGATFLPPAHVDSLPDHVDWREHGAVTPVKDQGQCGSCYTFSATGALEAMHHRATGNLVSLSEQNLIDCSGNYGNAGCEGGMMDNAFQYIKDNGGIDTEKSYPYEATNGTCRYNPKYKGATDVGFYDIKEGNEEHMKTALATMGPVSIAIDARFRSFQFYKKGVYTSTECCQYPSCLDHGVLAVGYGVDKESKAEYWLIKNSWGATWGDEGYIKIARNEFNMCGVATFASIPLV